MSWSRRRFLGVTPALLAGCAVVVKTAPETPLSSYRIAEAFAAAGIPPGVLSILPGDRQTGVALTRHPGVDRVSFTGSTAAGAMIAAAEQQADHARVAGRAEVWTGGIV